jgi:predicted ATPase
LAQFLGRDFSHAMINRVADLPPTAVEDGLIQLVDSGLLLRRGDGPDASYTFKHALIQDAAYNSLLKARRAVLHRATAEALEQECETVAMHPGLLGYHFAQADVPNKAVKYLLRAGQQAAASSAMSEAQAHLRRGLQLTAAIVDSSERKSPTGRANACALERSVGVVWLCITRASGHLRPGPRCSTRT